IEAESVTQERSPRTPDQLGADEPCPADDDDLYRPASLCAGGDDVPTSTAFVWMPGKLRMTNSRDSTQSANPTHATRDSLTEKRIRLGARNMSVYPSSQKRSARRECSARSAASIPSRANAQ